MKVTVFENGPFMVNTYLLYALDMRSESVVIDPGHNLNELLDYMRNHELLAERVLLTHAHIDHIAGIGTMRREFSEVKVLCSRDDIPLLDQTNLQARMFSLPELGIPEIDHYLDPVAPLTVCGESVQVLQTPGHSEGSVSFYTKGMVFTGDALFKGTVGRTDLFGGNHSTLIQSIQEVLLPLPDETVVYPGHGESTTIGEERKNNRYLRF